MENLEIYNKLMDVPEEAKKTIKGGRLAGMTDIKPMWRIEKLTETFGMCGIGWKAPITNKEIIDGANGEKIAIVDIELYVKINGEWTEPITGTGGSSFISKEKNGLYVNDECFKMAYTDALSVACKSLGMGAKVYWGDSKYNVPDEVTQEEAENYTMTFGKHIGKKISELPQSYIGYLLDNSKDERLIKMIEMVTGEVQFTDETFKEWAVLHEEMMTLARETHTDPEDIRKAYKIPEDRNFNTEQLKSIIKKLKEKLEA